jgi:hypothetical protein
MSLMHKLSLTNNGALLVSQILSGPDIFTSPIELIRAGRLMEKLELEIPKENIDDWMILSFGELSLSESERNILRLAIEKMITKIPASKLATTILVQLGFDE